jgi:DNA-directed RNA polymerase II subunit RPB1
MSSESEQLLQLHIATYMDNDIASFPQVLKLGQPVKAFHTWLKGKEGCLRGNLMGKHVEFSACTVIAGDPNFMLDEVGVLRSMAMNLTCPERGRQIYMRLITDYLSHIVTLYNIGLQMLVHNGP